MSSRSDAATWGPTRSPDAAAPRLLLVEGSPALGRSLLALLAGTYRVTVRTDARSGFDAGRDDDFDVLLVDGRLPGGDGADVVESLRRRGVTTPALMVSERDDPAERVHGLDAGADDYVRTPVSVEELHARLRAIRRSRQGGIPRVRIGGWDFEPDSRLVHSPYAGRIVLTDREARLLELLATRPHRTFARAEILRSVFDRCGNPGTVDTYVHYIRRKTDPELITTVHGLGYRVGAPAP